MRRKLQVIAPLLFVTTLAYADPIAIPTVPRSPEMLGALLIEVLVVAAMIWRFKLRMVRFIVVWYAVNLLTFYVLLQSVIAFLHSETIGEFLVFTVEAVALFALARLSFFKRVDSKSIPLGRAIAVSFVGNLSSIFSYFGIVVVAAVYGPTWSSRHPVEATRGSLSSVRGAIDLYTLDTGMPPGTNKGLGVLITDPGVTGWHGPYFRPPVLPKDGWGTSFRYRLVGSEYVIESAGPDRKFDTPDDICVTQRF